MRTVKTCFANKAAQLSPACRASMTVLDNRNKKNNTTRPKPCCQTPKPTLPKQVMTPKPTAAGMRTRKPTVAGMTRKPTVAGMTRKPTVAGTTRKPTVAGTTGKPTVAGTKPAKPTMPGTTKPAATTASEVDVIDSAYSSVFDDDDSAYGDADELMAGIDMATAQGEDLMSEPINGTTADTLSDPVADAAWEIETADIPDAPIPDAPGSGSTQAGTPNEPSSTAMPAGAAVGLSAGAIALVAALFVGSKAAMRLKAERSMALHASGAKLELAVVVESKEEDENTDEPDSTGSSVVDDAAAATAASPSPDVKRTSVASASAAMSGSEQSRKERRNKERKERKEQAHGASTEGEEAKQRKKRGTTLRKDEPAIDPENDL
jgi:hypothetical protein